MSSYKKLKKMGFVLGKVVYKAAKTGFDILKNMQSEYDSAQGRLDRRGIDDWDEDKLRQNLKYAGSLYEESIIRQKLKDKMTENQRSVE